MSLRYLTAGESHGPALVAILEGLPAGLGLSVADLLPDLQRRQAGTGRGGRMKIEKDIPRILSGVRFGETLGSPLALLIDNLDWPKWQELMASAKPAPADYQPVTTLRPGHADYAGWHKYQRQDIRDILERSSARETALRVAVGATAKKFLKEFKITITSKVLELGGKDFAAAEQTIQQAKAAGDSLGGIFEITANNVPIGLGSCMHYDRRLDALLGSALFSIQAIKGVEFGLGFEAARRTGARVHDAFNIDNGAIERPTNHAGGLEGGMTNGQPLVLRAAMKPIPTMLNPLPSVDMATGLPAQAHVERADTCAVSAAAVVGEAVVALELAKVFMEKYGRDNMKEIKAHFQSIK